VLGDPAGLARHHAGLAQRVEQRGLAVVDVTHDRHHRRPRQGAFALVVVLAEEAVSTSLSDTRRTVMPYSVATSSAVSVSITSLIFSMMPWRIMNLMTSTARIAIAGRARPP
jgi:NhaP-type Na+/H+ and K+/H+ antiporter